MPKYSKSHSSLAAERVSQHVLSVIGSAVLVREVPAVYQTA